MDGLLGHSPLILVERAERCVACVVRKTKQVYTPIKLSGHFNLYSSSISYPETLNIWDIQ